MFKYLNSNNILTLLVCGIPAALVAGAAVLEFFIALSCLVFFILILKKKDLTIIKIFFFLFF